MIFKNALMSGISTVSEDLIIKSPEKYEQLVLRVKKWLLCFIACGLLSDKFLKPFFCDIDAVLRRIGS